MKWIEVETVLEIHDMIINATGGSEGIQSLGALESALYTPSATSGGQELYPGIIHKVAVLLYGITNNHPFIDGNKRTAFVTALTVLATNSYDIDCTQEEVVAFMVEVAQGNIDPAISGKPVGKQFNLRINRGNYSLAPVYSLRDGRVIVRAFADILIFLDLNTFNPTMSSHCSDKTNNYHMHHPSLFLHT